MLKLTDLLQSVNDMIIMRSLSCLRSTAYRVHTARLKDLRRARGLLESSEANLHKSTWGDFINVMRKTAFGFCNLHTASTTELVQNLRLEIDGFNHRFRSKMKIPATGKRSSCQLCRLPKNYHQKYSTIVSIAEVYSYLSGVQRKLHHRNSIAAGRRSCTSTSFTTPQRRWLRCC